MFIDFHFLAVQCRNLPLVPVPFGEKLLKFLIFDFLHFNSSLFVSVEFLGFCFEFVEFFGDDLFLFFKLFSVFSDILLFKKVLFEFLFGLGQGDLCFEFFLLFSFELFLDPLFFLFFFFFFPVCLIFVLLGFFEFFSGLCDELIELIDSVFDFDFVIFELVFLVFGLIELIFFGLIVLLLIFVSLLYLFDSPVQVIYSLVDFVAFAVQLTHLVHAVVLLFEKGDCFGLELITDFILFIKFFFKIGLLIFVLDLNFIKLFALLIFYLSHLKDLARYSVVDVGLLLLEFVSFGLELFQILLNGVSMESFLVDHSVAGTDPGSEAIDLIFGHLALFYVVLLVFQVLGQTRVKHLFIKRYVP